MSDSPEWGLFYSDGTAVYGRTEDEWDKAPIHDVQVVMLYQGHPENKHRFSTRKSVRQIENSQAFTGIDEYSINGWSTKYGKWMDYDEYMELFDKVITTKRN